MSSLRTSLSGRIRPWILVALVLAEIAWTASIGNISSDVQLYHSYAARLLHGPATAGMPKEYPGAASIIFLAPRLVPAPYGAVFATMMALVFAGMLAARRHVVDHDLWASRLGVYLLAGTAAVVFARYDLVPAFTTLLAVEAAKSRRWGPAWAWTVLGAMLKLFPLVLLPVFVATEWRDTRRLPWRRGALSLGAIASALALQDLFAPGSVLLPFRYLARRGFEYSSVAGSLTLLLDPLHVHFQFAFGAFEIVGAHTRVISMVMLLGTVIALGAVVRLCLRGLSVEAGAVAALTVAIVANKSFAPQYLIWLAPLWAYWRIRATWLATAILSTLVFPVLASIDLSVLHRSPAGYGTAVLALLRNVVLIAGTLIWLVETARRECRSSRAYGEPARVEMPSAPRLTGFGALARLADRLHRDGPFSDRDSTMGLQ